MSVQVRVKLFSSMIDIVWVLQDSESDREEDIPEEDEALEETSEDGVKSPSPSHIPCIKSNDLIVLEFASQPKKGILVYLL